MTIDACAFPDETPEVRISSIFQEVTTIAGFYSYRTFYPYLNWYSPLPNVYSVGFPLLSGFVMEAVIFFTTVTFLIAVGAATVQGVLLWKRYRIRLHVTDKTPSINSRDLENQNPGRHSVIADPPPLLHVPHGSNGVRRWPESTYYDQTNPHWTGMAGMTGVTGLGVMPSSISVERRHMSNPFVPFQGTQPPIMEEISERSPTPATVSHLTPATGSRDQQGFVEQKP